MINIKTLPPPQDYYPIRRALLSVFDKTGLGDFAEKLHAAGVELISTGGTARAIAERGIPVKEVSYLTGYPEILDGRVKTLHPAVHGGLLARRNDPEDLKQLEELQIAPIDLVVVNLYPFKAATSGAEVTDAIAIENIDIGGPTMIRAAAKNFFFLSVVTSPNDYDAIAAEMGTNEGGLSLHTRRILAHKAFEHTALYDRAISDYFAASSARAEASPADKSLPSVLELNLPLTQTLRYGENPHQAAARYGKTDAYFEQLHGKALSFNNILDLSAALLLIDEFRDAAPTCAILKHTNPCGVGTAKTLLDAYSKAFATDRQSPFGGIVIVNHSLDLKTAEAINSIFTELIIAPAFDDGVLDFLMQKKNRRLLRSLAPARTDRAHDMRSVLGGLLMQERDPVLPPLSEQRTQYRVVTERAPSEAEWLDLDFAWRVVKHVKSNAIVYARDSSTIGIGAGQMSRIDSSEIAVMKGTKSELVFDGSVIASDAFFPFADGLIAAVQKGARAAIQPGGSIRDQEVIDAANKHGVAMIFTGKRHFRH